MRSIKIFFAITLFCYIGVAYAESGREPTLAQCQMLKDQIDHYTELRKKGGSAGVMEQWKQQREKLKEKFRDMECRQTYGSNID